MPEPTIIDTMEGRAMVEAAIASPLGNSRYMERYGAEIERLGWTHEWYDATFSAPIRVVVTRIGSW